MITYRNVVQILKPIQNVGDISVALDSTNIEVIINDCDEEDCWKTEPRSYNKEIIDRLIKMLTNAARSIEHGYPTIYHFKNFNVSVMLASDLC